MPLMGGLFTVGVSLLGFIADYLDVALTSRREFLHFAITFAWEKTSQEKNIARKNFAR